MKFVDNAPAAVAAKDMLRRGLTEGAPGNISTGFMRANPL